MAVLIEPMYLTEDGLEFITNPEDKVFIEQQRALDKFYYGFHIQILDGAIVYALYQNHDPTHYENMRRHYHKSLYDPHFKKVHPGANIPLKSEILNFKMNTISAKQSLLPVNNNGNYEYVSDELSLKIMR